PARLVGDRLRATDHQTLADLPRTEGCVMRVGGERLAVYRDSEGELRGGRAGCPHLRCLVGANNTEKSGDCPCRGTRFAYSRRVLTGPAVSPLEARPLPPTTPEPILDHSAPSTDRLSNLRLARGD